MFGLAAKVVLWMLGGYATYKVAEAVFSPEPPETPQPGVGDAFWARVRLQNDLDDALSMTADEERFADPIYSCFGDEIEWDALVPGDLKPPHVPPYTIYSNVFGVPSPDAGHAYLSAVANSANARIGAIRARVGAPEPPRTSFPSTGIGPIAEASFRSIAAINSKIVAAFSEASNFGEISSKFGLPYEEVEEKAKEIAAEAKRSLNAQFIEKFGSYAPVSAFVDVAVQEAASGGGVDPVAVFGAGIAAVAGQVIPILGAVFSEALKMYISERESRRAEEDAACQSDRDRAQAALNDAFTEHFPFPWAIFRDVDFPCGRGPAYGVRQFVVEFSKGSLEGFRSLYIADQHHVKRWWICASMLMSHPEVFAAFSKLGHGASSNTNGYKPQNVRNPDGTLQIVRGGVYGGMLASDEQVFLVAAPIAVQNGLSVDDFAKRLWAYSSGWRVADSLQENVDGYAAYDYGDEKGNGEHQFYTCPPYVANAWWCQWAVLSRYAFQLADELKGRVKPTSILGDPSTLERVVVTVLRPDVPGLDLESAGGGGGLLGGIARSGLDIGGLDFGGGLGLDFGGVGKDWPGVLTLPEPYKTDALEVLSGVSYAAIVDKTGAPCSGGCSSDAIYEVFHRLWLDQASVRGFGVKVDEALEELRAAHNRTKAYGL